MNEEVIETKLTELRNNKVVIVAPSFGTTSYSYNGDLFSTLESFPIKFHFTGDNVAILFQASDVEYIEIKPVTADVSINIIRLKGPHDYTEDYQKTP